MNFYREDLHQTQNAISDKTIDRLNEHLDEVFNNISEEIIPDFIDVYQKVLSSNKEKKKLTPADLYKSQTYWELSPLVINKLNEFGDTIIKILEEEYKTLYINIYEGVGIGERVCEVDDSIIQEVLNKVWHKKNWRERVWLSLSYLWDGLAKELMDCVIHQRATTDLKKRLQEQLTTSRTAFNKILVTQTTFVQTKASIQRYKDDRKMIKNKRAYADGFVQTYGSEELINAYSLVAASLDAEDEEPVNTYSLMTADMDYEGEGDEGDEDEDEDEESKNVELFMFLTSGDGEVCGYCMEFEGMIMYEDDENFPPIHEYCRCTAEPLGVFPLEIAEELVGSYGGNGFIDGAFDILFADDPAKALYDKVTKPLAKAAADKVSGWIIGALGL